MRAWTKAPRGSRRSATACSRSPRRCSCSSSASANASGPKLGHALLELWPSYLAYVDELPDDRDHLDQPPLLRADARTRPTAPCSSSTCCLLLDRRLPALPDEARRAIPPAAGRAGRRTRVRRDVRRDVDRLQRWWRYASSGRRLIRDDVPDSTVRAISRAFNPGVPMYVFVLLVAFVSPLASVALTFAIAAFYLPSAALFAER